MFLGLWFWGPVIHFPWWACHCLLHLLSMLLFNLPSPFGFLLPSRWAMVLYCGVATESFLLFFPLYPLHMFSLLLPSLDYSFLWKCFVSNWTASNLRYGPQSSTDIVGIPWTWVDVSCQPPTWSLSALNIYYQVLWEIAGITPKERCNLSVKLGQIKCKWMRWVFCISNLLCNPLSGWGISRNIQNLVSETRHSHRDMPD